MDEKPSWKKTPEEEMKELLEFEWDPSKCDNTPYKIKPMLSLKEKYEAIRAEPWKERTFKLLEVVETFTHKCSLCPLGQGECIEHNSSFDPHVFSNMNPSQWMVVGQNPGYNECIQGQPFVGDAGKFFDEMLIRKGIKRDRFYISNSVKCHTIGNVAPTYDQIKRCEPILRMEINIVKPILVITLGKPAFNIFCPNMVFKDSLGKISKSESFGVKIFPLYHPSPRNTIVKERLEQFKKDITILAKLILAHDKSVLQKYEVGSEPINEPISDIAGDH